MNRDFQMGLSQLSGSENLSVRFRPAVRAVFTAGLMLLIVAASIGTTCCQELGAEAGAPVIGDSPQKVDPPKAVDRYMGREVAQTMHYAGAEWLIRDEREREERCSMMLVNLGLKTGMTVCDMGCGNGFYSLPIAKLVGADGQVLAVDIQAEMLTMLRTRMEEQGVHNISPILGSAWDPHLPAATVDLVLMVDVYHEFSHPEQMLAAIRRSLAPGGVIVLVEYRSEDPDVPIKRLHKMSKKQVDREMTANGFELVRQFDRLPWQHLLAYGKVGEKTETPDGGSK